MSAARSLALLVLALLTLPACDSTEEFEIGGTYSGTSQDDINDFNDNVLTVPTTSSGNTFTFSFFLSENDGNGTVFSEETFNGTGSYDHPALALTIEGDTVSGTVSDDGDRITLRDDTGFSVVLTRD